LRISNTDAVKEQIVQRKVNTETMENHRATV